MALRRKGMALRDIATAVGTSHVTVLRDLKAAGMDTGKPAPKNDARAAVDERPPLDRGRLVDFGLHRLARLAADGSANAAAQLVRQSAAAGLREFDERSDELVHRDVLRAEFLRFWEILRAEFEGFSNRVVIAHGIYVHAEIELSLERIVTQWNEMQKEVRNEQG